MSFSTLWRTRGLGMAALMLYLPWSGGLPQPGKNNSTAPPAPGRLVDVGGWRLHLNCTGDSKRNWPTVVFESGSGDFSFDWSLVQPEVARLTRACSYDRAGNAWSDPGPQPRTMRQVAYELHTALKKADIKGLTYWSGNLSAGFWCAPSPGCTRKRSPAWF